MTKLIEKVFLIIVAVAFVVVQSGCSMFVGSRQPFSVTTSEPDAKIYINGEFIGTGNVKTTVPRNQSVAVMAQKEGYYPVTRDIGTKMSTIGILDIVGGCFFLLPFIGLAFPGSQELDQNSISLVLQQAK